MHACMHVRTHARTHTQRNSQVTLHTAGEGRQDGAGNWFLIQTAVILTACSTLSPVPSHLISLHFALPLVCPFGKEQLITLICPHFCMNLTAAESVSCGQDEPRAGYKQLTTDSVVSCTYFSPYSQVAMVSFPVNPTPYFMSGTPRLFLTLTCCLWCPFSFPLFRSKLQFLQCVFYSSFADSSR